MKYHHFILQVITMMKQVAQPVSNTLINNNHHRHHNNLNNTNFILKKCRTQIKNIFENIQQQH